MSLTKKRQEQIKRYLLEKVASGQGNAAHGAAESFSISLNTAYRYLREMEAAGLIRKKDRRYVLCRTCHTYSICRSDGNLENEDKIYRRTLQPHIASLPDNVKRIWEYTFMEMLNNALEHSGGENIEIRVVKEPLFTTVFLTDDGVGIFRKIQEFYHYPDLEDAAAELFKGKLTTDSKNHSGEGIFFTSRILDSFVIISDGQTFSRDNTQASDILEADSWKGHGTRICMGLADDSKKVLKDIFDQFTDDDGKFNVTEIPLKSIFGTFPVSRSQAKRLCSRCDNFSKMIIDFSGVEEIGQGFAHEVFTVFQNAHPEIEILAKNENKDVRKMIYHVTHP